MVFPCWAGVEVGCPGQTNLFDRFMVGEGAGGRERGREKVRREREREMNQGGEERRGADGRWKVGGKVVGGRREQGGGRDCEGEDG